MALAPCADEAAISKLYSTIRPYLEVSLSGQEPHTATLGGRWVVGTWGLFSCLYPLLLPKIRSLSAFSCTGFPLCPV